MLSVVELWRLDLAGGDLAAARELLSDDERRRLERIPRGPRAERFARARAALRRVLGRRLGVAPSRVAFDYGPHGKPRLAGADRPALEFNLSHSGDRGVVALAAGRRVGVDLQELRPQTAFDDLARRFYSRDEWRTLDALPEALGRERFFRWWARKEALVKARGDRLERGLATPVADDRTPIGGCSRCDLELPTGWAGALAVEGGSFELRERQLRG